MRAGDRVRDMTTLGRGIGTVDAVVAATYIRPIQYTVKVIWDNTKEPSTVEYCDSLVIVLGED